MIVQKFCTDFWLVTSKMSQINLNRGSIYKFKIKFMANNILWYIIYHFVYGMEIMEWLVLSNFQTQKCDNNVIFFLFFKFHMSKCKISGLSNIFKK